MAAILLGWNPNRSDGWKPDYSTAIDVVSETGVFTDRWSVGRHRNIARGSDVWLLLQGTHGHGLIGHGISTSDPYQDAHRSDPDRTSIYVDVDFDVLLPRGEQIPVELLLERVPGIHWNSVFESGKAIPTAEETSLRTLWAEYAAPPEADPTQPAPGTFPAGALTRVLVNRFERNPEARRACIAHFGTSCHACGISFEAVYGEIGRDFIQVHHIVPVSQLEPGYELDPITDLIPLCPNCHAMAHRGVPEPYSPAELRQIMAQAGHLKGTVVSTQELIAQEHAARILATDTDG